ncbi:host cell division inhibitor Icd-like protein [Escherichia coli]|nr:host cell division inhibitor Icd-like protein [Escherichia coli]
MKRPNVPVQGQGFVQPEISQNDILIRHKAESRIDSRLFAERIGIKHKSLYSLIQKHKTGLRELGILPFQTERLKTNQHGEREHKFALLNSDQFDYMRHIVSHFAAERMKHVKQYLEEVLSNYRAGGSVRREYLHDAGMAGKTKATTKGSPVEIKEIKRITNYAMSVAGGQGYQPGGRFLVAFNRRGYFSTKSSRANRFCGCFFTPGRGVNSSGSDISLARFSSSWRSSMRCKSCLRCSAKISVMDWYFLFMLLPCKAMRRSTSHHGADSDYSDSLALRRWRRLISPRMAVTINCAVLSPVSFTCSIASTTSCGARACNFCDLLLIWSLSISASLCDYWNPVYTKKTKTKRLKWIPLSDYTGIQLSVYHSMQTRLKRIAVLSQPLTTNDSKSIEAAMRNHITHPQGRDSHNLNKFTWRFMQCLTDSIAIFTVTAATEHEARAQLPHAHLIFAARIRQEASHG